MNKERSGIHIKETIYIGSNMLSKKYSDMPFKEWDGKAPLCMYDSHHYFFDIDEIFDHIEEYDIDTEKTPLNLIICEPIYPQEIDADLYWEEDLPGDAYFDDVASKELLDAFKKVNAILAKHDPFSWYPGEFRTTIYLKIKEKEC